MPGILIIITSSWVINERLEITTHYKYLGVVFSSNGSFLHAKKKHLVEQARKAVYLLHGKINHASIHVDLALNLFDHTCTISPILTYGSEIFRFENLDLLEKVHKAFLCKLTSAGKSTPSYFIWRTGPLSFRNINQTGMLSFWNRLLLEKQENLLFKIYNCMTEQNITFKLIKNTYTNTRTV